MSENKAVSAEYKFEDSKLIVKAAFDANKDGEPVAELEFKLHISEIPDEVLAAIKK